MEEGVGADGKPLIHPETLPEWRTWLSAHHAQGSGVWVASWKTATGRPQIGYEESVCEALCWGWIDSTAGTIDAERSRMWFAPRRPTSGWSRPNKLRLERIVTQPGRMQPPGQAVLDLARTNGSWTLLDDVEDGVVPADLEAVLAADPAARAGWDAWPPSARKVVLTQLVTAKKPETRAARIDRYVALAAAGGRP